MAKNQFTETAARMYDTYKHEFYDYPNAARNIDRIRREFGIDDKEILEVGIGTGNLAVHLVREGFTIDGVDRSHSMTEIAQKKFAESDKSNKVKFFHQKVERLTTERKYPIVLSHGLFTFIGISGGWAMMSYIRTLEGNRHAFDRIRQAIQDEEDHRGVFLINLIPGYRPEWKQQGLKDGLQYTRTNQINPYNKNGVAEVVTTHRIQYPNAWKLKGNVEECVFRKSLFRRPDVERELKLAGFEDLHPDESRGFYIARPTVIKT